MIRPAGERALLLEFASLEQVHVAWRSLRSRPPRGVEDIVAGSRTVLLVLRSAAERQLAEERLLAGSVTHPTPGPGREFSIPVTYDGPDLSDVAALTGLDENAVVRLHAEATYTVSFVGFSPGFAYLVGVDPALHVPRLATPRRTVPAGALAVAAGMTAVYPQATPGGWRLIGRSAARMFDPSRPEPSLLLPGDRVRFRPVDRLDDLPVPEPVPMAPPGSDDPGRAYLLVVTCGVLTTVQDTGRRGWAHLGVPGGGAADRAAALRANHLVGNPPDAAVLEVTMGGLRVRVGAGRRVAVTGALVDLTVDGMPARAETTLPLSAGSELSIGACRAGLRCYLAVEGGIDVPPVLGSRSADTLSGLGPPPLRPGDRLPLGPPLLGRGDRLPLGPPPLGRGDRPPAGPPPLRVSDRPPAGPSPLRRSDRLSAGPPAGAGRDALGPPGQATVPDLRSGDRPVLPGEGDAVVLTARPGPRDDWVGRAGLQVLTGSEYLIHPSSDRTGLRLCGPPVPVQRTGQLPSEGMVAGAVEIPPDGQPIVLLRNHPSTGGYPVAAVVDEAGLDLLAQCRPGVRVRFKLV